MSRQAASARAAAAVAEWLICLVPLAMTFGWLRGDMTTRIEFLRMLLATLIALGTQYLGHSIDAGLPSEHVTVF